MKEQLYQIRMFYQWYERLREVIEFIGGKILQEERHTDGSTICTIVFYSNINADPLEDVLRAKLSVSRGWLELGKLTMNKERGT